jgi:hypothetical protein
MLGCLAVVLLALPALRADDKPKDDKKEQTPKEQYQELNKEFNAKRNELMQSIRNAQGKERTELIQKYYGVGKEFSAKVFKIAENNPKDPIAAEAVFFVLQNGRDSDVFKKALEKAPDAVAGLAPKDLAIKLRGMFVQDGKLAEAVFNRAEKDGKDPAAIDLYNWVMQAGFNTPFRAKAVAKVKSLLDEMPLADLTRRVHAMNSNDESVLETVFKRAQKEEKEPQAADLLLFVATRAYYMPIGAEAGEAFLRKHLDHAAAERVCNALAQSNDPHAISALRFAVGAAEKPALKTAATFSLAKALALRTDRLGDDPPELEKTAAEAEKYFTMIIDELAKDDAAKKKAAQEELDYFRKLRVGKVVPEIKGVDLDEKEFKLSDYRGKVVLLDFWGNW